MLDLHPENRKANVGSRDEKSLRATWHLHIVVVLIHGPAGNAWGEKSC